MKTFRASAVLLAATVCLPVPPTSAGPPLSIDDPEILDRGTFEVIVAGTMESRDSGDAYLFPVLDVSYGFSQDIQLSVVATRAISDPEDSSTKSDVGPAALGVKWRFLEQERLQMSVAPFFEFLPREGAADRGVTEDVNAWGIPVQFQYEFDRWRLNSQVGYDIVHDDGDEWNYGIAAAYPFTESLELLAEINGGANSEFEDHGTGYLVGFDLAFSEAWHLLASIGSSFHEAGDDDLDVQGYLGIQWFPDP